MVGKIIADTYNQVGDNGIVAVEKSQGSETSFETTNGLKVDRGYSSPLFVNNQKKDECIMEDVHILVSDAEINNILVIENILKPIINDKYVVYLRIRIQTHLSLIHISEPTRPY